MKKFLSIVFSRMALVSLLILAEVLFLIFMLIHFNSLVSFYWVSVVISLICTIWVVGNKTNPGYKIAWIVIILAVPFLGGPLYLLIGGNRLPKPLRKKMRRMELKMIHELGNLKKADALAVIAGESVGKQVRYIERIAHCPVYGNTETQYFSCGELFFVPMLEELKKAEKYIFMEYFIIQEGKMFNAILDVLKEKAAAGLDVRVLYDDIGCALTLPSNYPKKLESMGVKCQVFNRFIPIVSTKLNNRDHRKFCIIDGTVGFTGGLNLSDEYINAVVRYGRWKDSAIMLRGDAVWSMAVMFLTMWDFVAGKEESFKQFRTEPSSTIGKGVVQPYTDSPWDDEAVGQTVYINLIQNAEKYVYITTPYLIIDYAMQFALSSAAKSGVDVRIITPHIPDKRLVFEMTRAHYRPLLEAGVKIYEYIPGFMHAKNFAVDDRYGTVGSINLDYRSMFLHFENGVFLCGTPCIQDIKEDFLTTLNESKEITLSWCKACPWYSRFIRAVLRIFAPLM
jgi:cardiolipin synthase